MSLYPIRPSFAAGVLTPTLHKRTDLNQYYLGLKTGENIIVLPQGGAINRPGFEYIAEVKDSSKKVRLEAFEFSTEQAYVLEFGDYYMRVYKDGGQVVDEYSNPYEIATPWPEEDLFDLRFVQSADTLFVFHEDYAPRTITRTDHTSWTLDTYSWENGPFFEENDTGTTLTVTGAGKGLVGETVTVTASSALFASDDVGRWIKIRYNTEAALLGAGSHDGDGSTYYSSSWECDGPWECTLRFNYANGDTWYLQLSLDGGTTWDNYHAQCDRSPVTLTGEHRVSEDGIVPRFRMYTTGGSICTWNFRQQAEERYGYIEITGYTSSTEVTGVVRQTYRYLSKANKRWSLGAWGNVPGWPKTAGFGNGRFWQAGTPTSPQTIWGSKTQDYTNHGISIPLVDDDAVSATLDSSRMNAIEHLVAMNKLLVFTSGSVWLISGGSDEVITPSSIMARMQEGRGANNVMPLVIGNSILFCTRQGNTVRELAYSFEQDSFTSLNRTILSQHLFDGHTITQMTYQQEPWSVVWAVRDDGKLLTFTYLQEHEVFAWTMQEVAGTDAVVESVCSIPGTNEDEVWIAVKRTINGSTVRYVERLHTREWGDNIENAFFVDSGLTYDGVATTTISGLDHLEGEDVSVLADGDYVGVKTVSSGQISLDTSASVVQVGLGYQSNLETLGIEVQTNSGTIITRPKLINTAWVSLYKTQGIKVGPNAERLKSLPDCTNDLFSGDARILMDGGWDQNGHIYIRQDKPLPMTILAVTPQLDVGRR